MADVPTPPGGDTLARSRAFRQAALRSEELRAYAVLSILLVIAAPVVVLTATSPIPPKLLIVGAIAGLLLLTLQGANIAISRWARRRDRDLPFWPGLLGVAVECSIPTVVVYAHLRLATMPAYTALTAPPLIAYAVLISLTTLRLRPWLCVWGGLVACLGYGGLIVLVAANEPAGPPAEGWPPVAHFMAALLIFTAGVAGAWVAREIRDHVGAALAEAETRRRVERLEHDLGIARAIQQALLPRSPPVIPGYDIAGWNRPADQTGGDYYDWQSLPDRNWIVSLADVSGHGIGPALVTAACRAYVRASAGRHADLASLASDVNRLLSDDLPDGRFVTMVNVLIDHGGGPMALLSAGHGPIVLFAGESGQVRDIRPHALPLAVAHDASFGPPQIVPLAPGDVLALVTDGFTEWARAGADGRREEYGIARLRHCFAEHARLPAAAIIEALVADVAAFAGAEPQQDDLTIVVIRRVP